MINKYKQKIFKCCEGILDLFLVSEHFRNYMNCRYDFSRFGVIPPGEGYFYKEGILFEFHDMIWHDCTAFHEYSLEGLRPTDTVLDIGATGGGFTILASRKAMKVFAVEPLYSDLLRKNVKLNKVSNVVVFDYAIRNSMDSYLNKQISKDRGIISYGYRHNITSKEVTYISFRELLTKCECQIDFLKMDFEGGEFDLNASDFVGIRRVEVEVHEDKTHKLDDFVSMLESIGYTCTLGDNYAGGISIIHATR